MFLTLPDANIKVKIWVRFDTGTLEQRPGVYRMTTVIVSDEEGKIMNLSGFSKCSPLDNFCRLTGRKLACMNLFMRDKTSVKPLLSKKDRAAIFDAVCAAYKKRAEKGHAKRKATNA